MTTQQDNRTMAELCTEAIECQNACNAVGVMYSAHKAGARLLRIVNGTDAVNKHPVMRLFVWKLANLSAGYEAASHGEYYEAYSWCRRHTVEAKRKARIETLRSSMDVDTAIPQSIADTLPSTIRPGWDLGYGYTQGYTHARLVGLTDRGRRYIVSLNKAEKIHG